VRGPPHEEEDDVNAALRLSAETVEAAEHANELPFDPAVFGIAGFGGLVALLLVAYAFRSVGHRH
jgi:hypothetical protein